MFVLRGYPLIFIETGTKTCSDHSLLLPVNAPEGLLIVLVKDFDPLSDDKIHLDCGWDQVHPGACFGQPGRSLGALFLLLPFIIAAAHLEGAFSL